MAEIASVFLYPFIRQTFDPIPSCPQPTTFAKAK
jgi:hypothetical protein